MVWRRDDGRQGVRDLLKALETQARDAMLLAERAQRDMSEDRFASFLDFRRKVEEVRALLALTEERLQGLAGHRLDDLHAEFERMDVLLTTALVRAMRGYFGTMRDDQVLPVGARELFEPELRNLGGLRDRLTRPQAAGRFPDSLLTDLEETMALIRKTVSRAPSLPDFSDAPTMPKPLKRLRSLGRPIRT
ncbi:hypothetical protein [Azospirillum sp. A39]|uniref:hypothetical protein n=1 Tax=Azospirillum sp. A39 TaxID=3462279 RepID=UPI0040454403